METTIATLDQQLRQTRPAYYASLQEGLTEDAIQALENQYQRQLPDDLKQLYKWKNGQADDNYDAFLNNSLFVPLEQALDTAAENISMIGSDFEVANWWHAGWIPLFHNGGGDYICYDTTGVFTGTTGQLIEFWHADDDRNVIAPSLAALLEQISQYYATTPPASFDEYFEVNDLPGYPQRFKAEGSL
ncbi:SMI1/KNR4 family protein [Chitinophaga arvensicola]|uniref:Cell wall assembly regulator SMI1 n=1 Tax=Chitinophaga arvensicola TaxID=29529 RepID=A0A1I0S946_9BACT|nr:SMI1/KNR4 family protein [Chitinophaga arvensicola]SEW52708.1 Cell wall assembly regulator SMI1 [Chitinophaga arvensicola]